MDQADVIWNRALSTPTDEWRVGDNALAAALRFHSASMSGGVLDAVENSDAEDLDASQTGCEWLGLGPVSALIADVRSQIDAGVLEDVDRADELERLADDRYSEMLPTDAALAQAFRSRLEAEPAAFAAV